MKRFISLIITLFIVSAASAQSIRVKSFERLPMDMTAKTIRPVNDQNGDKAAIIKVVTNHKGFIFENGMMGIVEVHNEVGEMWVYVPYGTIKLTIKHPEFGIMRDYFLPDNIDKAAVYEMRIECKRAIEPQKQPLTIARAEEAVELPTTSTAPLSQSTTEPTKSISQTIIEAMDLPKISATKRYMDGKFTLFTDASVEFMSLNTTPRYSLAGFGVSCGMTGSSGHGGYIKVGITNYGDFDRITALNFLAGYAYQSKRIGLFAGVGVNHFNVYSSIFNDTDFAPIPRSTLLAAEVAASYNLTFIYFKPSIGVNLNGDISYGIGIGFILGDWLWN